MNRLALIAVATLAGLALMCDCGHSGPPDGGSCPAVALGCPDGGPASYDASIGPLLEAKCGPCHGPGQPDQAWQATNETWVQNNEGIMLTQVFSCAMPNADGGGQPLTQPELQELVTWLVCGAPSN
jgi:hypothetical protein